MGDASSQTQAGIELHERVKVFEESKKWSWSEPALDYYRELDYPAASGGWGTKTVWRSANDIQDPDQEISVDEKGRITVGPKSV